MVTPRARRASFAGIPPRLRWLFWDGDCARLTWECDRDFIVGRILAVGDWEALEWLRRRLRKPALRDWLESHRGGGLSPPQLGFWEIVLEMPRRQVNGSLRRCGRQPWDQRRHA